MEYVAPKEYMMRAPQAPIYVFVVDVSYNSVNTGVLATFAQAIQENLEHMTKRTLVAFITFDSTLQFYSFKVNCGDNLGCVL